MIIELYENGKIIKTFPFTRYNLNFEKISSFGTDEDIIYDVLSVFTENGIQKVHLRKNPKKLSQCIKVTET